MSDDLVLNGGKYDASKGNSNSFVVLLCTTSIQHNGGKVIYIFMRNLNLRFFQAFRLKFIYPEKAAKLWQNLQHFLKLLFNAKQFCHIFVVFSEYMHFIKSTLSKTIHIWLLQELKHDFKIVLILLQPIKRAFCSYKKCVYVPYRIISILVGNEIASAMILICHMPLLPFLRKKCVYILTGYVTQAIKSM